jgi:hypothetical protein
VRGQCAETGVQLHRSCRCSSCSVVHDVGRRDERADQEPVPGRSRVVRCVEYTRSVDGSPAPVVAVGVAGAAASTAWTASRYVAARSRCLQPGQQQGRRRPSSSSSCVRRMRRSRVVCCLASSTQQMNSLRAKGVMSFQASSAVVFAINASRRSAGSGCTTPPGTRWLLTGQTVARRRQGLFLLARATRFTAYKPRPVCALDV